MGTHKINANLDVLGEVQGTSLDINGNAVISSASVALANQPAIPLLVDNAGGSVDGRVFINVKHNAINTAAALGAGLQMQAGAVTSGTASYFSSQIFLQSASPGNHTIHSAPKGIRFYVDNHDTAAGAGTSYAAFGDLAFEIFESGIAKSHGTEFQVAGNLNCQAGTIELGGTGRITGVDTVSAGTDAANKTYVDTMLPKAGGTMSGAIAMGNQNITGAGTITGTTITATNSIVIPDSGTIGSASDTDAISIEDDGSVLFSSHIEANGNIIFDGNTITGVNDSGEFDDDDAHIMTSAGINDRFAVINADTTGQSGSCSGLAATATALATARNIGGVSFNGTSAINLPGVNTAGNQNTSGTAAIATACTITANNSGNETIFPVFVDGATGTQGLETDTGFTFNPSTGTLVTQKISTDVASIVENNKSNAALMTLTGQGAGNQSNISLHVAGNSTSSNVVKIKMTALAADDSTSIGAGILSYLGDGDTFNIGQSTTHNSMAISIDNDDVATFTNAATLSGGFVLDGNTITGVDNASEFTDNDAHIMTSTAIKNKIADNDNSFMLVSTTTTQTGTKTFSGVIDITNTTASSNASGDTGALRCEGGASIAGKIYAGSTITGSADVIAFSDRKLKENIETLDGKKVLDMRGVSFTRKDTGAESSGVIAQEIQKVAPELVHDTEGTLGVAYGNLVGYLIEAVKDQQKQIDELKEMCSGCSK